VRTDPKRDCVRPSVLLLKMDPRKESGNIRTTYGRLGHDTAPASAENIKYMEKPPVQRNTKGPALNSGGASSRRQAGDTCLRPEDEAAATGWMERAALGSPPSATRRGSLATASGSLASERLRDNNRQQQRQRQQQ